MIFTLLLSFFIHYSPPVQAEPWVSNRFAQNCSACHSPNRNNVPLLERRCTLSCQGCHVNPNGGGVRNRYGAWNQNRFLRSLAWPKIVPDYKQPAPVEEQLYYIAPEKREADKKQKKKEALAKIKDRKNKKDEPKSDKNKKFVKGKFKNYRKQDDDDDKGPDAVNARKAAAVGLPLVTTNNLDIPEEKYRDYRDWRFTPDKEGFMKRLTVNDPYREEINMRTYMSGDFRYMMFKQSGDSVPYRTWRPFLMSVDLGARLRPIRRYLSFVAETRWLGNPDDLDYEYTLGNPMTRSFYILVDEIPGNTYFMAGLYRPLFGNYTPDHTALAQEMAEVGETTRMKAISIGTAPNVPFLYVHYILPEDDLAKDQSKGTIINLGGRFVTKGLSGMLSLWNTTKPLNVASPDVRIGKKMTSFTLGAYVKNIVVNAEILRIEREFALGQKDAGVVYTTELKYRFWRENYLLFNYAASNIARNYKEGDTNQMMIGAKSFLFSGLELEFVYKTDNNNLASGTAQSYSTLQMQAHMFF
ncbi:MAG: hypothetical protein SGJ18_07240 [Pseudomonadota bacterium]|nr:hypothetical protein [Pseudomonadota bacterium]